MGKSKTKPRRKTEPKRKTKSAGILDTLATASVGQIDEVAADVTSSVKAYLSAPKHTASGGLRGRFTESVQNIFAGGVDDGECCRLLGADLAPFVDGPALATALRYAWKAGPEGFLGELVDQFAIRAVDDLARGMVALALGRPSDVPATCAGILPILERHVDEVKALLVG